MEEYLIIKQNGQTEKIQFSEREKYTIYSQLRSELVFLKSFLFLKRGSSEISDWEARLEIPSDYTFEQETIVKSILKLAPEMKSFESISDGNFYPWPRNTFFQPKYNSLYVYDKYEINDVLKKTSFMIYFRNNIFSPFMAFGAEEKLTEKMYVEILESNFGQMNSSLSLVEWIKNLTANGDFVWHENFKNSTKLDLYLPQTLTLDQRSFLFSTMETSNNLYANVYIYNIGELQLIFKNPTSMDIMSKISFSSEPTEILTLRQK